MALLAFNAIGSFAPGQIGRSSAYNLAATAGNFAYTGAPSASSVMLSSNGTSASIVGGNGRFLTQVVVSAVGFSAMGSAGAILLKQSSNAGSFAVSTTASPLLVWLPASATVYSSIGNLASLQTKFVGMPALFMLTGYSSIFDRNFEAWFPRPFDENNWMANMTEHEFWLHRLPSSSTWVTQSGNAENWTPSIKHPENWIDE